jgi:hypothetical protein
MRQHQTITWIVTSSLERYWVLFLTKDENQNRPTRNLIEYAGHFPCKVT